MLSAFKRFPPDRPVAARELKRLAYPTKAFGYAEDGLKPLPRILQTDQALPSLGYWLQPIE